MLTCNKCFQRNSLGTKLCSNCGLPLIQDEGRNCPICGNYCGPYANQCKSCNHIFKKKKPASISKQHHNQKVDSKENLVKQAIEAKRKNLFIHKELGGTNKVGSGSINIQFHGDISDFTKKTLIENYDIIANNLLVYPLVKVYPEGKKLPWNTQGRYYSDVHLIELECSWYTINTLAREMRHAYQYVYFPDMYFADQITNAKEYVSANTEKDARQYAIDYCDYRGKPYFEERDHLIVKERDYKLFLDGHLSAYYVGLDDESFKENPRYAQEVLRDYHERKWFSSNSTKKESSSQGTIVNFKPKKQKKMKKKEMKKKSNHSVATVVIWSVIAILCVIGIVLSF